MTAPTVRLKETSNGYTVAVGEYTTDIRLGEEIGGIIPLRLAVSRRGVNLADTVSSIKDGGKAAVFDSVWPREGISKTEGLLALGALVYSIEEVLRRRGVERVTGRMNPAFARFMGQMGYSDVASSGGVVVIEKNIQTQESRLPKVWEIKKRA